jgi:bacteriocin-like protein
MSNKKPAKKPSKTQNPPKTEKGAIRELSDDELERISGGAHAAASSTVLADAKHGLADARYGLADAQHGLADAQNLANIVGKKGSQV